MPFKESLLPFFEDFGIVAKCGDLSGLVILDEPDHEILNGRVTSTAYAMTFPSAQFPHLAHGDQVTIGIDNYNVVAVNKQSDGVVSIATLQRVPT